jgi:hypothetical protein
MSGSFLGVVMFFEQEELQALTLEFSDRLRRDPELAPVMKRFIGNRWAEAEAAFQNFLQSQLFGDTRPTIDMAELERATCILNARSIDRLVEVLLESALLCLPLHSAARIDEVGGDLGGLLKSLLQHNGDARVEQVAAAFEKLSAGALHSSF